MSAEIGGTEEASSASRAELVRCEAISVRYGKGDGVVLALSDIELSIASGETLALWGTSGSGKSTLLYVLGGLLEPTSGRISWKREGRSSLVFQGANLLPTFTAFENVAFAARNGNDQSSERPFAQELLELVGLGNKFQSLPAELSGGEQQRVAIARALVQTPTLLLCDEPTGQLDSDTAARVLELIEALQERLGFALVTATHDAHVASRSQRQIEILDGMLASPTRGRG